MSRGIGDVSLSTQMLRPKIALRDIKLLPESVWVTDLSSFTLEGTEHFIAIVQDVKTLNILGWVIASERDEMLMLKAVEKACAEHPRTRSAILYLGIYCDEKSSPKLVANLRNMEFQLRWFGPQELSLIIRLENAFRKLRIALSDKRDHNLHPIMD